MTEPTTHYRMHYYTIADVLREREEWWHAYARSETHERFGQWFWNRYEEPGPNNRWPELFYAERANDAQRMLIAAIGGYQRT